MATSSSPGLWITAAGAALVSVAAAVYWNGEEAAPTAPEPVLEAAPQAAPPAALTDLPQSASEIAAPKIDLLRVEKDGSAVLAGVARHGQTIEIELSGQVIHRQHVAAGDQFVALFTLEAADYPRDLRVVEVDAEGTRIPSAEAVLVMAQYGSRGADGAEDHGPPPPTAPKLVMADQAGVRVLADAHEMLDPLQITSDGAQLPEDPPAVVSFTSPLVLDAVSYEDTGAVLFAGRGRPEQFVRIYVNDQARLTQPVSKEGHWQIVLDDMDAGIHQIRVDQIDATGSVGARVETPFMRQTPESVLQANATALGENGALGQVVVQPGNTLWALAKDRYGSGMRYIQIFEANRKIIRDADLIYPGQIFSMPEAEE